METADDKQSDKMNLDSGMSAGIEGRSSDSGDNFLETFKFSNDKQITNICEATHAGKILEDTNQARKSGSYCDITLLVGEDKYPIQAHRLVLSCASNYFEVMFASNLKEASQTEIELPRTEVFVMESLIKFAYTGQLDITNQNIEQITRGADFFGMPKLLEKCVQYIIQRIDYNNCVEVLALADHLSKDNLKQPAKKYFIDNFEGISTKSLDIFALSTPLVLEIIADNSVAIHGDPSENEERLLQFGWNHLQTRSDEDWSACIPKLLNAVHLPQVTDNFLCNLKHKVEKIYDAKTLVEKAESKKSELSKYRATVMAPKIDVELEWCMKRFQKSARLSVTCHDMKNSSVWFGEPVFIQGMAWCIKANMRATINSNHQYLACYITTLHDIPSVSITSSCNVILDSKDRRRLINENDIKSKEIYYDSEKKGWGYAWPQLWDLSYNSSWYNNATNSCKIEAVLTIENITFETTEGGAAMNV